MYCCMFELRVLYTFESISNEELVVACLLTSQTCRSPFLFAFSSALRMRSLLFFQVGLF